MSDDLQLMLLKRKNFNSWFSGHVNGENSFQKIKVVCDIFLS